MKFERLAIRGAALIRPEPVEDDRGSFARVFCGDEFAAAGLPNAFVQSSLSFNRKRGTVRGMHFQWPPSKEGKLVRCVRGAIHDVLLDLRPDSPSYLRHAAVRLDEANQHAVFIPHGVAHGFQTLADSTEVLYQMTDFFAVDLAAGYRWNDPTFGIKWPISANVVISERDASYADFASQQFETELVRRQQ